MVPKPSAAAQTPQQCSLHLPNSSLLALARDCLQSPGNLGTSTRVTFPGQTVHQDKPHLKHGASHQALG